MIENMMYNECLKFLYHKKEFEELFRLIKREYEKIKIIEDESGPDKDKKKAR